MENKAIEVKLLGWTQWLDPEFRDLDGNIPENAAEWDAMKREAKRYMKEYGIKFGGFYHQNGEHGTPYFDNGRKMTMGFRQWGRFMVDVLGTRNRRGMAYGDWAWTCQPNAVYPTENLKETPIVRTKAKCSKSQWNNGSKQAKNGKS